MPRPQGYVEKNDCTEEEHLWWEKDAPYMFEYVRGEIKAMSGGTVDDGSLSASIGALTLSA